MTDTEKILAVIENQRWFFFENNNKILFDRDTALLWANLKHFPYSKRNLGRYSPYEVNNLIKSINSESWGRFSDWKIPTPQELWKMIMDRSFPFQKGTDWRIKGSCYWCVYYNGAFSRKDLDEPGETNGIDYGKMTFVIPCSSALVPENFSATPQEVLDIFRQNNLIPILENSYATNLYKKLLIDKPAEKVSKPAQKTPQTKESLPAQKKLSTDFDYRNILAKYDAAAIKISPIKYYAAARSLVEELLDVLQQHESAQAEAIATLSQISLKLGTKYIDNPYLTPEENSLLAERQKFLAAQLSFGTDKAKTQLLSVKAQAEEFSTRLERINDGENSLRILAELEKEPRPSFEFLVENLSQIVQSAMLKPKFLLSNKELISSLAEAHADWGDDYKVFQTGLRGELKAICRKESIESEIFDAWYEDWRKKRFAIEQKILPLMEFILKGNLLNALENILKILQEYREAIDKFYLQDRKNIYQKFAFQAGGDLQEKFESESELYKPSEKFHRALQEIIFSRDKTEERIFLLKWAEPLLNMPLDELNDFIRARNLETISEEVMTQFSALRQQNFAEYLSDNKAYVEALQKREKEFNALIFRMRKDLPR